MAVRRARLLKHKANVDFTTFRDIVTPKMAGNRCEIRIALGSELRNIPRFPNGRALILDSEWKEWLHEIDLSENTKEYEWLGRDGKERDMSNFVSTLQSRGDGSKKLAAALYYRLHYHVEDLDYAHRVDKKVFEKGKTFESINSGTPVFEPRKDRFETTELQERLAPPQKIRLGPVTILLGSDDNPIPLSLQEANDDVYIHDGKLNVFKALNWRSRLTSLHGRLKQYNQLLNWARNAGNEKPKVMLVSGPGGVGKTRLVVDVVDKLVETYKWAAYSLKSINNGDVLEVGGKGVALVIDYPEENTDQVKEVLKAAAATVANDTANNSPVRVILVSRENLDAWGEILNDPHPYWIEEIRFEVSPYLDKIDALQITEDIAEYYPKLINRQKPVFSGVEAWLDSHPSHRLPLITLAASIHAVLEPEEAFTLAGKDVLIALAQNERKRVRYYSERNLKNVRALEKLLALSLLTENGLSKETICALGDVDICPSLSGNALLEAVQQTPFWKKKTKQRPSHLVRLEPDRLGAYFLARSLNLEDAHPSLVQWITTTLGYSADGFGYRLARLAYDISTFSFFESREIEKLTLKMVHQIPELATHFGDIAFQNTSEFSAEFSATIITLLLDLEKGQERLAALHNNLAVSLGLLQRNYEACAHSEQSVEIYRELADQGKLSHQFNLITTLCNLSVSYTEMGSSEDALRTVEEARTIAAKYFDENDPASASVFASVLNRLANRYSEFGKEKEALSLAMRSVKICKHWKQSKVGAFSRNLPSFLVTLSNRLSNLSLTQEAVEAISEAEEMLSQLNATEPEKYRAELALSQMTHAKILIEAGRYEAAQLKAVESVEIYEQLTKGRPRSFSPELADALVVQAETAANCQDHSIAISSAERAAELYRSLQGGLSVYREPEFAKCSRNLAIYYSQVGNFQAALDRNREAVSVFHSLAKKNREVYLPDLAMSLNNLSNRLSDNKLLAEALLAARRSAALYRRIYRSKGNRYTADFAMALSTYSNRLKQGEEPEKSLKYREEAIALYEEASANGSVAHLLNLALVLNNHANALALFDRFNEALEYAEKAQATYQNLFLITGAELQPQMALNQFTLAQIKVYLELFELALLNARKGVVELTPLFLKYPLKYTDLIHMCREFYVELCGQLNRVPDEEVLGPIDKAMAP